MKFSANVTQNNPRKFSWWLYGDNGRKVAWAGQTWDTLPEATAEAKAFKAAAETAEYDVFLDGGQDWRWRAWNGGRKVASAGESFDNKQNAERAAENVRQHAGSATGP